MTNPLLSVVAPMYNEGDGVDRFVRRMAEVLGEAGLRYELVLVDDGSADDSWDRVVRHNLVDVRVRGVQLSRNFGKESAVLAGLEHADGDLVVVIDSDLQHPPSAIPAMVQAWRDGAHVVEAVKRNRTGQSIGQRITAKLFNATFTRLTTVDLVNATDFRLMSRQAVDALLSMPEHSSFFRGTSSWIGFRRATIEIDIDHREGGVSRWTFASLARLAVNGLTSFTSAPLHLVTIVGCTFAAFSVVLGIQTLVKWIRGGSVAGFPTVILLLLVMGTFVLLGLGVIGEYLARIHEEVRGRPRYLVQDRANIDAASAPPPRREAPSAGPDPTTDEVRDPELETVPEQWVVGHRIDSAER